MNLLLLAVFAVQHSVMARPAFKRWWTRLLPAPIERSTCVLLASLLLLLPCWQWRPMPAKVWGLRGTAWGALLQALFWLGWATVILGTFLIDHFDLFGLRQVCRHLRGLPLDSPRFATPLLYRVVRHPIMLGFLTVFWTAPHLTSAYLLFAAVTTAYVLVAIRIEEHDLVTIHGDEYRRYRERTSMPPLRLRG